MLPLGRPPFFPFSRDAADFAGVRTAAPKRPSSLIHFRVPKTPPMSSGT